MRKSTEKYVYKNCPIPGGGYVTGFVFHEKEDGIFYCRTDIGGTYGFDNENQKWVSLIDHVTMESPEETFPIALALDPEDGNILYIACGINGVPNGKFAYSEDKGENFTYYSMPVMVHGNLNGRGTGFRLIVDKQDSNTLWFASQQEGLWKTCNKGESWIKVSAFPEEYMTFVGQSSDGNILFAAGAGVTSAVNDKLRGHSLYVSMDKGNSFLKLDGPEDREIEGVAFAGHVAQRYSVDENYLYVTYAVMGRNAYVHENGYSCDGGSVIGGRIYRYSWESIYRFSDLSLEQSEVIGEDITPQEYPANTAVDEGLLEYGFSGICASIKKKGLVIASTISKENGDCVFRSLDYGQSWECILYGLDRGIMDFRTSYMKPEHNGGGNLIHWLSDLKINPFDENEAWFNTGTGVFVTKNLCAETVRFSDWCDGIEETVHLNLYSPPSGDVRLIDILGDLGGFAFSDLDKPCRNSFDDENGNRYITCINADYSDNNTNFVVVTPRGNWTGKTKGGLILSSDQCRTFKRIALPYGLSEDLDEAFHLIETPNVNSGWVAMSQDTKTLVWSVAQWINLPCNRVIVSHDLGESFHISEIYNLDGTRKTEGGFKVFADRTITNVFYGFGDHSDMYISMDSGDTFRQVPTPEGFPTVDFSLIDCANKTEIRFDSGHAGHFYMALGTEGLWSISFDSLNVNVTAVKLTQDGDSAYRLGLGIGSEDADYFADPKALYFAGTIDGEYGFYRTTDNGKSYTRLNSDKQMFGDINSLEADSRVYGRFYLATGSRGVIYGTPAL